MEKEKRLELIKRNVEEIVTENELKELLENKKIYAYWGTAPTGPFHIGHVASLTKIFDFERAKIKTKILIADIHAALDDLKAPWDQIKERAEFYKKCIELVLPWQAKPYFVIGSEFQLSKDYMNDVLKIATITTTKRALRAASEVCRLKNPKVSELIYPIMQSLDEQYLNVDIQLGGIDQRHIMMFAREYLPKIGYRKRIEIMMPLLVSLTGPNVKMSASVPETHVKVYDSVEKIKEKIRKAYCPKGVTKNNPIIQICKLIIFPLKNKLKVERAKSYGGDITFEAFEDLEKAFALQQLHPLDLKEAVANSLIELFKKVRKYFENKKEKIEEFGKEFLP